MTRTKRERERLLCEAAEIVEAMLTVIPVEDQCARAELAIGLGDMGSTTAADRAIMTAWGTVLTQHGRRW